MNELRASDLVAVRDQLGRDPTTPFWVVARCTGGHPLVIRNRGIDANGDPFPTRYWLTCPDAVKAVARLESGGAIAELNDRVHDDEAFDRALEAAHRAYADERGAELDGAQDWGGVAGTRTGVKCLHAHYAYHLAGGVDPVGTWTAERVEPIHPGTPEARVAAIDQGTNSIRLFVAEPRPGATAPGLVGELARDMTITRLGAGVDATGRLEPDALRRTVVVLATYCRRARALGARRIRVAATSAVRDAENRDEFAAAVREHAGSELEIITGEQEAGLSFLGAVHGLREEVPDAEPPYAVLDIGGGSTELVVGEAAPSAAISTQTGSVRLTERHVRSDPPTVDEIRAIEADVAEHLETAAGSVPVESASTLIVVGGTATTLKAMELDLPRYDPEILHRTRLDRESVEHLLERLARMTGDERDALPFMAPGRGDVIVAGAVILELVMQRFGFADALVSETDILDGLVLQQLPGVEPAPPRGPATA
ncbi:MAG: DUF501 domain-containing protein [Actinomycetota bacterium]